MRTPKLTIEHICYLAALLLAVLVRFLNLGQAALPDSEAVLALQSFHLAQGGAPLLGPNPGYVLPTALLMFLGGVSNWTARFWPAVFGVLLLGVPYILRERLGRSVAVTLAFFIALDPGLAAASRQAGDQMIGLSALLLSIAFFIERKAIWAGIFGGLALLGGPPIWPNALVLAASSLLMFRNKDDAGLPWHRQLFTSADFRAMGLAGVAVLLLAGTCFFFFPVSLSAGLASLPAYLQGWAQPSGLPILRMLAALGAYEVFGLILGLGGLLRGLVSGSRLDRFLAVWWGLAVVLAVVYPARQVLDLTWALVPMLALAARWVEQLFDLDEDRNAVYGQGGLIMLLLIMISNLVVSWPAGDPNSTDQLFRYLVLGIAVLLIAAETFLVVWGWSSRIGLYGLALGIAASLFIFSLSALGNSTGIAGRPPAELWRAGPAFAQADLLSKTLSDHIGWRSDTHKTPEVVLLEMTSPALEWLLRGYPGLRVEKSVPVSVMPEFLISTDAVQLDQAAAYTGTGFDLSRSPTWDLIPPTEWVNWLVYRTVRTDAWAKQTVILWVRSDLFPGANIEVSSE